jgi:rhodanese-related sulfurtransferase
MMKLFVFSLIAVVLAGCQTGIGAAETASPNGGSYQDVTADDLHTMLKDKDFVLVNVHIPFAGNIADTDLSIPYDQIGTVENLAQLPTDKSAKIVLYCRSGRMSAIAAEELVVLGYTNIRNLDGGMDAWIQAGFDLEK